MAVVDTPAKAKRVPWNKGKKTAKKVAKKSTKKAAKGGKALLWQQTPEGREAIAAARRGKKWTDEQRASFKATMAKRRAAANGHAKSEPKGGSMIPLDNIPERAKPVRVTPKTQRAHRAEMAEMPEVRLQAVYEIAKLFNRLLGA